MQSYLWCLLEVVKQAIAAAYPTARLEEVEEHTVFSKVGKISGTIGGEFTLKKSAALPISTYLDSKRDASRTLLNALSSAGQGRWCRGSVFLASCSRRLDVSNT